MLKLPNFAQTCIVLLTLEGCLKNIYHLCNMKLKVGGLKCNCEFIVFFKIQFMKIIKGQLLFVNSILIWCDCCCVLTYIFLLVFHAISIK